MGFTQQSKKHNCSSVDNVKRTLVFEEEFFAYIR